MRESTLPSPGILSMSHNLRRMAARAISAIEISARYYPSTISPEAQKLEDFFTAAAAALAALADVTAPTVTTRVRTSATVATITFNEALDTSVVPALASITIGARTLSQVQVIGSTLVVTGVGITAGDTFTYTKPATAALRDPAGNQVATFSGVLA